jgi:hypothetical protein
MTKKELAARELQDVRESTLAIVSLVAAIAGWSFLPVIGGVIAIITGHLAKNEIRESEGRLRGDGLATAGLAIGYACVGFFAVILMTAIIGAIFFGFLDLAF